MCIVSMVVEDLRRGPNKIPNWIPEGPVWPNYKPFPPLPPVVTPNIAKQMKEVLERLDKLDKALGNLDCLVEQKAKDQLIEMLLKRAAEKVAP